MMRSIQRERYQQQPLLGAPARSAHRSPEIHGPLSPIPTLFFVDFSRYFHVSLSYTSSPSARIRGTKRFVRLLSWLHPIHEVVRLSKPLIDSELRRTLHYCGHSHVADCRRTLISYGTSGRSGLYFQNVDTPTISEN